MYGHQQGLEFSEEQQREIIRELCTHRLYRSYPPPLSYQLCFLKWTMSRVESHGHQVCEELYELYGALVSQPQSTQHNDCYKSYLIAEGQYITLKESSSMISEGTTGLTTWQAAFHFLEWAMQNLEHFNQKRILELGSGVGLVGLSLCRVCAPLSYCFTDCHPHVLSLLQHNLHINLPDGGWSGEVSVKELDWRTDRDSILSTCPQPLDYVIATDVVYDETVIDALVHVLKVLLSHCSRAVAYVASTIRSEKTYQYLISRLAHPQLCYRRNPTLADSLVKASLPGSHRPAKGQVPPIPISRLGSRMVRCTDKRCKVCPKAEGRRVLFSTVSNTPYTFHEVFTCADTSLIYCNKCGKLYIGLTSNSLKVRFRAHRHFSETKRLVPLYHHFARKSHDFLRDHRIVPLEHCEPDALPVREAYWIRTLHTLIPHGLNSAYGKPFYPYDHSLLPPSPPTAGTPSPPGTPPRDFS